MGLLEQVIGAALGSRLGGGGRSSPLMLALMALLASRAGGFGSSGGLGGLGGLLGGLAGAGGLGGAGSLGGAGGLGGLGALVDRFQRSGHGDVVDSWIGTGENRPILPNQLEEALGAEDIDHLSRHTGMPRQQLLSELSEYLPRVVDQLTPRGRLPDDDEMSRW